MADTAAAIRPHATHAFGPDDTFAIRHATDAQIAPDASRIAYIRVTRDRTRDERLNHLMLSADRRTWHEIADGASAPRWAPDSRRLAFLRRTNGRTTLVVHDTDTGTQRTLLATSAALREIAWSPDGTQLAYQMHVDDPAPSWLTLPKPPDGASWAPPFLVTERLGYRHDTVGNLAESSFQIHILPADGTAPLRQLTSGPWSSGFFHAPCLAWSADGRELLLTANRRAEWDRAPNELDIHAVSVADGSVRQLTDRPGVVACVAQSPDGRYIAHTGVVERGLSMQTRHLFLLDTTTGTTRELLPTLDRNVDAVAWRGDSAALFICYDGPGQRCIARVALNGSLTPLVQDVGGPGIEMPYSGGGFSTAADGTVAYVRSPATQPSDVAIVAPDGATETITDLNDGIAAVVGGFAPLEEIWFTAAEGHRVQAWLMRPNNATGRLPLILEIHGGPFAQYGERFSIKHQMLAAAGYAVLAVNPRGSPGYGEAFANALHDRYPGPDYDDLMQAVDLVAARPDIDADNLFITGISGGGTLSLWAIGHTHRFRAAVSIKPVVAWESWLLTADVGPIVGRIWMGGKLPWEDEPKFRIRSPLAHLAGARTPTMLIAGEADSRTPISEAQQAYAALKLLGVEAALVRGPGVVHSSGSLRPSHFAAEVICTLAWFERFRKHS